MRIQTRFILSVAGVLTASLVTAGWSWQHVREDQLEAEANLPVQAVSSLIQVSRNYAADLAHPGGIKAVAQPFMKTQPGYQLKEACDNPVNPADLPDHIESTLLQRMRNSPVREAIRLFVRDDKGKEWYVAGRPIVAQTSCLECHGSANHAPAAMLSKYGSSHGYGWEAGQVVGAQVVRLDIAELRAAQSQLNGRLLVWGCEVGLAALIGVYVFTRWIVTKPLTRVGLQMQAIAQQRNYRQPLAEAYRKDELGTCATAFNNLLGVVGRSVRNLRKTNANLEKRVAERTAELEQQNKRTEAATRAKSDFLANMSHEIRTPLNGAIGAMQLLESSPLNEKQRKFASTARACANALLSLINDVLDFSKIEAGKLELSREAFDLRQLIDESVSIFAQRAAEKELTLTHEISDQIGRGWWGDSARIRQVIVNLIGNAIKFTSTGGVHLRVDRLQKSGDFSELEVRVRDTGIGIPKDRQNRLFKSFSQVDASTTRQYGGTGLGLAITRQLAELMGGKVGLESQEGVGSTFWFTAWLQEAPLSALPEVKRPPERDEAVVMQGGRILVVDDNDVNQMILLEMLKQAGYTVQIAGDGKQALELHRREQFDLIITDCQMPVMDGYEFAKAVRADEAKSQDHMRVPVIALTASALKVDGERCMESGMDDYATKPIDQDRLLMLVRRWMPHDVAVAQPVAAQIEAVAAEPEVEPTPPAVAALAPDAQPIEMTSLVKRCMGDEKFAHTMLDKFQQALRDSFADIEKAFGSSSPDAIAQTAHKLKGSASYLSAEPVRYFAAEIEGLARKGALQEAEQSLERLRPQVQRCLEYINDFLSPPQANVDEAEAQFTNE